MNKRIFISGLLFIAVFSTTIGFADNYWQRLATNLAMYAALAWSWNLIGGYAGYPSFGTAAFFGLGAYSLGVLQSFGFSFTLALACTGLIAAAFGALLGSAILRLRGHYFAIASLVIADVLREITNVWTDVTGGGMGLNLPILKIGEFALNSRFYLIVMTLVALLGFAVSWWVKTSRLGVALGCIEQNEDAAQTIGINTSKYKTQAFILSGLVAGLAGGVYASWVTYIDPTDVYDVSLSVKPIVMALMGGVGTLYGPLLGAGVYLFFEEVFWSHVMEFHEGLLGILIVLLVLYLPGGVSDLRKYSLPRIFANWTGHIRRPA